MQLNKIKFRKFKDVCLLFICSDGRTHPRRSRDHSGHPDHPIHMNPETNSYVVVPLTSRLKTVRPPNQKELLSELIPKLEELQRDQKTKERLDQMMYSDETSSVDGSRSYRGGGSGSGQVLADAILKKLQPDDDNDQSILDQHVLRVWSDLTPHRSPGTVSPCPDMQRMRSHDIGIGSDGSSIGNLPLDFLYDKMEFKLNVYFYKVVQ